MLHVDLKLMLVRIFNLVINLKLIGNYVLEESNYAVSEGEMGGYNETYMLCTLYIYSKLLL